MSSVRPGIVIACAWLVVAACSDQQPPAMELLGMVPSQVRQSEDTRATVLGRGFRNVASDALGDNQPPVVNRDWRVTVPDTVVADAPAIYTDDAHLGLTLPTGLPLGPHDLLLTAPSGQVAGLTDAFEVVGDSGGAAGAAGAGGATALGAFGPSTPIAALVDATSVDDDPTFTADLLELYFSSDRAGGAGLSDIWVSRRTSPSLPWGAPTPVVELNLGSDDALPGVSPDGLTLWISSDRPGGFGTYDIWVSTRPSRTAPWSAPVLAADLSSTAEDLAPQVSEDGLTMVITSTRPGGPGGRDLCWSTRASPAAPWRTPVLIEGVNTAADDSEGRLMPGGLELYFRSASPAGDTDLFVARRASVADAFSAPQPITELDTAANEDDPWLSLDGRYLMYSSDQTGSTEIYEARR